MIGKNRNFFVLILSIFIITEIIDNLFDYLLGPSLLHSILQVFLFIMLFFVITKLFLIHEEKKMKVLIPETLMEILRKVDDHNKKGVLVNQVRLMKMLGVTKPTIRRRLDKLYTLGYLSYQENGNNKFIQLTTKGRFVLQ
ncbi:MAG: hypothetical protein ACOCWQ_04000 [Nanoarchaeota archaeon]